MVWGLISMIYTIEAENLLVNYFATHNDSHISISRLKRLREGIESEIPSVYLDITRGSIDQAILQNPGYLDWGQDEGSIICINKELKISISGEESFLENNYNWDLPSSLKRPYLEEITSF